MHRRGEQGALERGAGQAELVQPSGTAQVFVPTAAQARGTPAALATARQTHKTHPLPPPTVRETRGKLEEKAQKNSSEAACSLPRVKPPPSAFGVPAPWEGFFFGSHGRRGAGSVFQRGAAHQLSTAPGFPWGKMRMQPAAPRFANTVIVVMWEFVRLP